jgi:hypothetical protein
MMSCVPSFRISLHLGAQQAASNTAPATRRIRRGPLGVLSTAGISPSPKLASVASTARSKELWPTGAKTCLEPRSEWEELTSAQFSEALEVRVKSEPKPQRGLPIVMGCIGVERVVAVG